MLCTALLLGSLGSAADTLPTPAPAAARHTLRVGSVAASALPGRARVLRQPRSPPGSHGGRFPGTSPFTSSTTRTTGPEKPLETLVATEGGPGYPATLSRDGYLALFEPLRRRHDVLLMDNRGTGQSGSHRLP